MPGLFDSDPGGGSGLFQGLADRFNRAAVAALNPTAYYQQQLQQQQLQATYNALRHLTPDDNLARAAALNPEILKQIAPELNTAPQLKETGTDPLTGQRNFGIYRGGQSPSMSALSVQAQGGQPQTTSTDQLFNTIEQGRTAGQPMEQLLQNVPNSIRSVVDALIKGKSIPSNLPPRGPSRDMVMRLAHAVDPTFDETLIPQRQTFAHGMGQTNPSSNGGQKILLNTALQHGGELADALEELHNTNGPLPTNWIGSGPVANVVNSIKNTSANQGGAVKKVNETAARASGEVGKLYSGSAGGGETERLNTAKDFSKNNTPFESAGALSAFRNLIFGKLNALQTARDQVYGQQGENIYPILDPKTKEALAKIDAFIGKYGSESPQSPAAPKAGGVVDYRTYFGGK